MARNVIVLNGDDAKYPVLNKPAERTIRGVLTATGTSFMQFDMSGYGAMSFTVSDSAGNANIKVESSNDGIAFGACQVISLSSRPANLNATGFTSLNGNEAYQIARPGRFIRITQTNTSALAIVCVCLYQGGVTPKQQEIDIPNSDSWAYVSPSAITTNTAVTLTAATTISALNILSSIDITNTHDTGGSEILIRSGASGTVLWRSFIMPKTTMNLKFTPGISALIASGTGQLLEFAVVTTGANIFINARGYKKVA